MSKNFIVRSWDPPSKGNMETFAHDLLKACLWRAFCFVFGYPKKKPPCRKEAFLLRPFDPHHPAVGLTIVIVKRFVIGRNTLFIAWLIQLIRKYTTCGGWFWAQFLLESMFPITQVQRDSQGPFLLPRAKHHSGNKNESCKTLQPRSRMGLSRSRSAQKSHSACVCITCQHFNYCFDKHCRTHLTCHIQERLIPHGAQLTSRCPLWQQRREKEIGWCPVAH